MSSYRIVIPARYASSRLPGKPLLPLAGKPMIQWVWENAVRAGARDVIVATDDQRIAQAARGFGADACLTAAEHPSGTDRLAEVAALRGFAPDDVVVNLQGDEPNVPAALLQQVASAVTENPDAGMATLATPVGSVGELFDPNAVKVVLDDRGFALYFSRAPIPWVRDAFKQGPPASLPSAVPFLRHLGLYAYRARTLASLSRAPAAALEGAEALEQLRALALGIRIHVGVIAEAPGHGVDTEADLARVEALLLGERH